MILVLLKWFGFLILLANHMVVAECNEDTEFADDLKIAVGLAPYNKLVDTCIELVKNDENVNCLKKMALPYLA